MPPHTAGLLARADDQRTGASGTGLALGLEQRAVDAVEQEYGHAGHIDVSTLDLKRREGPATEAGNRPWPRGARTMPNP